MPIRYMPHINSFDQKNVEKEKEKKKKNEDEGFVWGHMFNNNVKGLLHSWTNDSYT